MTAFLAANLAPVMFAAMVIFMLTGFPVAFALAACGLFFGWIGIELGLLTPSLFQAMPNRLFGLMMNETLLAIPFFTFMGLILERSGMAEELLDTVGQLFGSVHGGLAYAVIIVGALLPGFTLTLLYMGFVFLCAVFRPSSVPGVPPEVRTLIGPKGTSGLPSLIVLGLIFLAVVGVAASMRPRGAPVDESAVVVISWGTVVVFALTALNRMLGLNVLSLVAERTVFALVPPLALIFLVLGSVFVGLATPTEGGAMGATGALILALLKRRLSLPLLRQAMGTTARLTTFVLFILIGARIFSLTFYGIDGHLWVEHLFDKLPGGELGFLILVNVLVFLLAFFLDFFELAFIVVPLLAPVAHKLGIDLIWFGVLLSINMQTSFMHPPFGAALFFLRSVAPREDYVDPVTSRRIGKITWGQIYVGSIPFVVIQVVMVVLVIAFPQIVSSGLTKHKDADPAQVERALDELDTLTSPGLQFDPLQGLGGDD